jgi:hypothetical protein
VDEYKTLPPAPMPPLVTPLRPLTLALTAPHLTPLVAASAGAPASRGLHCSTFQMNLSRFGLKNNPKHPLIPRNSPNTHCKRPLHAPCPTESAYVEPKSGRV